MLGDGCISQLQCTCYGPLLCVRELSNRWNRVASAKSFISHTGFDPLVADALQYMVARIGPNVPLRSQPLSRVYCMLTMHAEGVARVQYPASRVFTTTVPCLPWALHQLPLTRAAGLKSPNRQLSRFSSCRLSGCLLSGAGTKGSHT